MGECLILKSGGGTDTSDANATKEVILSGYTAYVNDVKIIGSMTKNNKIDSTINSGDKITLSEGYYPKGSVSVNSLASQTDANATAAQIINGYTAWVNGSKITGSMPNWGSTGSGLAVNGTYTIPAGWHSGAGKVTQSIATQGAQTVTPRSWNQLMISAGRYMTGNTIVAGDGNLSAGNIKNGVWIFGVCGNYTGNVLYSWGSTGSYGGGVTVSNWNNAGSWSVSATGGYSFDSSYITLQSGNTGTTTFCIRSTNAIDYSGISYVNIYGNMPHYHDFHVYLCSYPVTASNVNSYISIRGGWTQGADSGMKTITLATNSSSSGGSGWLAIVYYKYQIVNQEKCYIYSITKS